MDQGSNPNKGPEPEDRGGCASVILKIVLIGALLAVLAFGTCLFMLRH
jgi:hypothetical protein